MTMQKAEHAVLYYPGSFIDAADGSQMRALGLLNWLCANFTRVTLYSFGGDPARAWTEERREALARSHPAVRLVVEEKGAALAWLGRVKKLALVMAPSLARHVLRLRVRGPTPEWEKLLSRSGSTVFFVNYFDALSHLNGIAADRCTVETHDIQFFRRSKGAGRSPLSFRSLARLRAEFGALGAVAGAVGISRNEAYFLRNMAPGTAVFYVPDYERLAPQPLPASDHRWDLLFVGSSNVINERGLIDLFGRGDLALERYRIAICGSVCKLPSIRAIAAKRENVELLGFVDDLAPVYGRSKACLSPTEGTGLNIKIVEALRCGRPVFATRNAMDALTDGYQDCVLPLEAAEFSRILADGQGWERAAKAASDYYVRFTRGGELDDCARFVRTLALAAPRDGARPEYGPLPA